MGLEDAARFIQAKPPPHAVEEPRAQHLLKFPQAARHRRLRDVQPFRRDRHAFRAGNLEKGADVPQTEVCVPTHTRTVMHYRTYINIQNAGCSLIPDQTGLTKGKQHE